jgi:nucleoside-diphosphate-sugar epimerase
MKRIFMTGSSGCIGHYLAEILIENTDHELFLLVRNPEKLKFDYRSREGIHILQGNLESIEQYAEVLKSVNVAILVATSWGGDTESFEINVKKTLDLINLLDFNICEQVIYFSTASILDRHNQPLKEAGEIGTNYVRTKYLGHARLQELPVADKITTIYPTLVFGGDKNKPYSHISGGLPDVIKYMGLVRWFKADASFHFIHAQDIAQVVAYLVDHPPQGEGATRDFVLGNKRTMLNEAVEEICQYLNKRIYFRIPFSIALANFFIKVFGLKMAAWDRFSLEYRHFYHLKTFTPASFGLKNHCSTIAELFAERGI